MKRKYLRFLQPVFELAAQKEQAFKAGTPAPKNLQKDTGHGIPPEFNGKEYISFLLHINAEIEHGLMVQYLYAAYSLGGEQVPEEHRDLVRQWQEVILGVAKEEMGHFVSCQNILRLIGAPLNFSRDDYPWDTPFYPFPFALEPLSLDSLAKYVFAESPEGWIGQDDPVAKEIKQRVQAATSDPHRVGALFQKMEELICDPAVIGDEFFQEGTYPFQAKFNEWGRGYSGGDRGNASQGSPKGTPDVLVMPLLGRDDAVNALKQIAEQGESPDDAAEATGSHFQRFLNIYKALRETTAAGSWEPARKVAFNPFISAATFAEAGGQAGDKGTGDCREMEITHPEAKCWAELFNLRYRMLLNYLTHSFQLDALNDQYGSNNARGTIIAATFGEMYNLRAIANVLVRLPLQEAQDEWRAGPPFMMPYTLDLPMGERNRWLQHTDLIEATRRLILQLRGFGSAQDTYLNTLYEADDKLLSLMLKITGAPAK